MSEHPKSRKARKWLILPPIILGIVIVGWFQSRKKEPVRKPIEEYSRVLRVIQVPEVDVVPKVVAYGTVEPGEVWRAVTEVKGRVIEVHPELKPGVTIQKKEEILRIDPAEYELTIAQLESEIDQINSELSKLEAEEKNLNAQLKIEQATLVIVEKALERSQRAAEKEAIAQIKVESAERDVLIQQMNIQSIQNSINFLPSKIKSQEANRRAKKTRLEQAKLDWAKTVIKAPFACVLGSVDIEIGQFLAVGETLFEAYGIDVAEIEAKVPPDRMTKLFPVDADPLLEAMQKNVDASGSPLSTMSMDMVRELAGLSAKVRFKSGSDAFEWDARFDRFRETIDPETRTIGVVVAVDRPFEKIIPGKRPALFKGMFCEVEIIGRNLKNQLVIPRSAFHNNTVYVVDQNKRLEQRPVKIGITQKNIVTIAEGLQKGETVIISDPSPAIQGMLVEAMADTILLEKILAEAKGTGDLK